MNVSKVAGMAGGFFFFMQFSTVILFNQMLDTAKKHQLPMEDLIGYQTIIMKSIIGSFLLSGILFLMIMIGLIRNVWRTPKEQLSGSQG